MTESKEHASSLAATFAPLEAAILKAFAVRSGAPKPLASLRPLVWLAYLALAQWFGLAHIISPEMRGAAFDAARRPGRRKAESTGQTSLFDLVPLNDGRPGIHVSFACLKLGNVCCHQGDDVLDLMGITELDIALVRAYEQGWIGGPSGNGLRFIPPTVWGLVVDHNSAGFARNGGVDEYIESLESTIVQWKRLIGFDEPIAAEQCLLRLLNGNTNTITSQLVPALHAAYIKIDKLETSIAESARLPTTAIPDEPCEHKSVTLFDGVRTCNSCKATLPNLPNEKVAKMRKNAHAKLTENEEPREPSSSATVKASKSSRAKESINRKTTKKAMKGRAS